MKTPRFSTLSAGASSLVLLLAFGCSKPAPVVQPDASVAAPAPASKAVAPAAKPVADNGTPVNLITDTPSPAWDDIKAFTFDQRADFLAGYARIEARLDAQIGVLNAKRATMTADTKDWDFAMKEVNDARASLKWLDTELSSATADTWNQEKDKVEQAIRRADEACEKVKASTTS